jgi:hypothetical protein
MIMKLKNQRPGPKGAVDPVGKNLMLLLKINEVITTNKRLSVIHHMTGF